MKTWHQRVHEAHERDHKEDGLRLVTGPPASPKAIVDFEHVLGWTLPAEFHGLYQTFDGVGLASGEEETLWLLTPLAKIPQVIADVRTWFADTHPALARRYFPFIDWGNGDSSGYLLSEKGELLPGIWIFEHEAYEFDEAQPASAFLAAFVGNLQEFFEE